LELDLYAAASLACFSAPTSSFSVNAQKRRPQPRAEDPLDTSVWGKRSLPITNSLPITKMIRPER
jgi:hypothetical protein